MLHANNELSILLQLFQTVLENLYEHITIHKHALDIECSVTKKMAIIMGETK